jgi:hypothetical protein
MAIETRLIFLSRTEPKSAAAGVTGRPGDSLAATAPLGLRAGEWIEVRSVEEILATLDANGCLDELPFMPEMVQYCGRRFRVHKSAHKTCDTIDQYVIRRMHNAVHLEGLRCDGDSHGGCQAGCLLFWKEAWLKRAAAIPAAEPAPVHERFVMSGGNERGTYLLDRATRVTPDDGDGEERYRCQATELLRATAEVRRRDRWDPRFYVRDLTSGNVSPGDFIRYGLLAIVNAFLRRWCGRRYPSLCGRAGTRTPTAQLNLRPGELVRVRSKQEILQTLNPELKNRGLRFDVEMLSHCGSESRVLRRVERIIDEKTGRLLSLPTACVILDGVTCSGCLSMHRMFCPRSIYPYWREIWLDRAGDLVTPDASGSHAQGSDGKS